jgi:hypothetical protein
MYFRKKVSEGRVYLQIAESRREGKRVRQRVICTLGRLDELQASGQIERLVHSGGRFAEKAMVLSALQRDAVERLGTWRIGPALVFERLWAETGLQAVIEALAATRKHDFAFERAVFLTVLHRLFAGGSDRHAARWREDYRIAGTQGLDLHHLYRAMAWLGEELGEEAQSLAPRTTKDLIEEELFARRRDLFSALDVVFMDTTSLAFEGAGGQSLGQRGYSKDHRPDLKQMILAVVLDQDGRPICCEMWPGNTADVRGLIPVVDRLKQRFAITRVCVVADRGMISAETIAGLEERGFSYILGARERSDKLVREVVLADTAPFVPLALSRRGNTVEYGAKEVKLAGARYIVCRNHDQARRDAAERAAILEGLERQLKKGDKSLVSNAGYRRYLKTVTGQHFAIDPDKVAEDAKFDGTFVLRTNTKLNPIEAMLRYKQLWTVEHLFRAAKHLLATRPVYHKFDRTIRGHVFCSFLALVLKAALEARIAALGEKASWSEIIADLDRLDETEIEQDQKRFLIRSHPKPGASLALRAAKLALPPTIRQIAES